MTEHRMERLEARVRSMESRLCPSLGTDERSLYEQQLSSLREDFQAERRDRERMAGKAEHFRLQLERVKKEFNRVQCELMAVRNVRRYRSGYSCHPPYQCDDVAGDEEADEAAVDDINDMSRGEEGETLLKK